MVPPAMMTALHSFSTWAKWTAGFNSRNLTLLSDKVPARQTKRCASKHFDAVKSKIKIYWLYLSHNGGNSLVTTARDICKKNNQKDMHKVKC